MLRWIPLLALVAACAPPQHLDPVPARGTAPPLDAPTAEAPPRVQVALFDPSGNGSWGNTIRLTPAPEDLVAPCVHGHGFAWVRFDAQKGAAAENAAARTDLVDASPDLPDAARSCITNALAKARLPPEQSLTQLLVYVTFSPSESGPP